MSLFSILQDNERITLLTKHPLYMVSNIHLKITNIQS
jgi:hypothetical protein